jgi:LacI family transcriptional regulator
MSTLTNGKDGANARVTIQDVAELAGVSLATVSRVLNSHPDVSPATRTTVLRHIRDLGYVSNRSPSPSIAEIRSSRRTRLIGLTAPQMRGDYVTEIVTGAVEAFEDREARLVICSISPEAGRASPLRERLLQGATDGALLIMPSEQNAELFELYNSGYPFVVVEPTVAVDEGIPAVAAANWAGAKQATEHLIGLGHTHIGVITGPGQWRICEDRLAGYHAALLAAGFPLAPHLVQESDMSIEGGYQAANRLLALPHVPSAIFALSDGLAVGVLRAARAQGLNVPHDLSVTCFDHLGMASITTPMLTTVEQPLQGLGRVGADMLWRLVQGQQLDATRIELSTRLVVRDSTAPPRGTSFLTI